MKEWIENEKNKAEIIMKENQTMYQHELLPENETTKKINNILKNFVLSEMMLRFLAKILLDSIGYGQKLQAKRFFML